MGRYSARTEVASGKTGVRSSSHFVASAEYASPPEAVVVVDLRPLSRRDRDRLLRERVRHEFEPALDLGAHHGSP
jgi:hypothetical protein